MWLAGRTLRWGGASLQLVVNDLRVEIGAGFDGETLRRLVGVLREAAPC